MTIDGRAPVKLIYETWLPADDSQEKGEWKSLDGSFDSINEQDATEIVIVESTDNRIPLHFFQQFPDIKSLKITDKRLKSIETADLLHANALFRLNVSHNDIDSIAAFAFDSALKLTEIDLSFNLLNDLNENIFTSYSIKYLYLHNNQLNAVNAHWFENLLYLRVLTLNNNRIRAIDFRLFEFMPTIYVLHLHSNEITDVHNDGPEHEQLQQPRSLQTFSMHDNAVALESLHLIWLNADTIDVRNTGAQICHISQRMRTVIASNNDIREINLDNLSVPHENALVTLHLANNQLKSIENVTHFHRLQYLNLSYNLLTHVDAFIFATLNDLHTLDVSHNQLKRFELPNNQMTRLNALDVSFNELLTLNLGGIMSQLQTLNITGNAIQATDSMIKMRRIVNHEEQCADDSTTCHSQASNLHDDEQQQTHINDEIRHFVQQRIHLMENNILQLIAAQFNDIRGRIEQLEHKLGVIPTHDDEEPHKEEL